MTEATTAKLETKTCSRCGGCGRYSWCQRFGDRCFKCGGSGKVLTARGQVAANYLQTLRCKRADQVVLGDVLLLDGVPEAMASKWFAVEAITTGVTGGTSTVNGVTTPPRTDLIDLVGQGCALYQNPPESLVRVRQTKATLAATYAAAVAYQETLTQAGTVRKGATKPVRAPKPVDPAKAEARREARAEKARAAKEAKPASDRQLAFARKLGASEADLVGITLVACSTLIDGLLKGRAA